MMVCMCYYFFLSLCTRMLCGAASLLADDGGSSRVYVIFFLWPARRCPACGKGRDEAAMRWRKMSEEDGRKMSAYGLWWMCQCAV